MYRVGLPQRFFQKGAYISNVVALTVFGRSLDFLVAPNWFLCTDATNYNTRIFLYPCGIPSRNLFSVPVYVRNLQYLSQLPDCLVQVDLAIPLVVLIIPLVTISRRLSL